MAVSFRLLVFISFICIAKAELLSCKGGSRLSDNGLYCECNEGLFYNALEGRCQGICEHYGDALCGPFSGALCKQDKFNTTSFSCECPLGFLPTEDGFCFDSATCEQNTTCNRHEECLDLVGEDTCICADGYYRTDEDDCKKSDPCHTASRCSQICTVNLHGETECSCFEGYFYTSFNYSCTIDSENGFEECECDAENPDLGICTKYPNGTEFCNPKPGYQFQNGSNVLEDIDECEEGIDQCGRGTICYNTMGSYYCSCPEHYEYDWQREDCFPLNCTAMGLYKYEEHCVNPCGIYGGPTFPCNTGSTCMVNDFGMPTCKCLIECVNNGRPITANSNYSIYSIAIDLAYFDGHSLSDIDEYRVTTSFESIFGIGNAEIESAYSITDYFRVVLNVGVAQNLGKNFTGKLEERILSTCWNIKVDEYSPITCVLPGGIFIHGVSEVEKNNTCYTYSSFCRTLNASCIDSLTDDRIMPGRYECKCLNNYELTDDGVHFYCSDINDCVSGDYTCPEGSVCVNREGNYTCEKDEEGLATLSAEVSNANAEVNAQQIAADELDNDLNDQKHTTKVVGGVVGALFAVVFVALVISGIYIFKIKFT